MKALVTRAGRVLSRWGRLPELDEVEESMIIVVSTRHVGMALIEASTGEPEGDGWAWLSAAELQSRLDAREAEAVGEALLC